MDPKTPVICNMGRNGAPLAHAQACVVCNVAQQWRAYQADRVKAQVADSKTVAVFRCGRCTHPLDQHELTHLGVGDCGQHKGEPHPEVVWKMKCAGLHVSLATGALPCSCNSYVMKGGKPPGAGHPG